MDSIAGQEYPVAVVESGGNSLPNLVGGKPTTVLVGDLIRS